MKNRSEDTTEGAGRNVYTVSELNMEARAIPVSHAFHSAIVAPAADPLRRVLAGLQIGKPQVPILSNVTADYYPDDQDGIIDLLGRQIESPVGFLDHPAQLLDALGYYGLRSTLGDGGLVARQGSIVPVGEGRFVRSLEVVLE